MSTFSKANEQIIHIWTHQKCQKTIKCSEKKIRKKHTQIKTLNFLIKTKHKDNSSFNPESRIQQNNPKVADLEIKKDGVFNK